MLIPRKTSETNIIEGVIFVKNLFVIGDITNLLPFRLKPVFQSFCHFNKGLISLSNKEIYAFSAAV